MGFLDWVGNIFAPKKEVTQEPIPAQIIYVPSRTPSPSPTPSPTPTPSLPTPSVPSSFTGYAPSGGGTPSSTGGAPQQSPGSVTYKIVDPLFKKELGTVQIPRVFSDQPGKAGFDTPTPYSPVPLPPIQKKEPETLPEYKEEYGRVTGSLKYYEEKTLMKVGLPKSGYGSTFSLIPTVGIAEDVIRYGSDYRTGGFKEVFAFRGYKFGAQQVAPAIEIAGLTLLGGAGFMGAALSGGIMTTMGVESMLGISKQKTTGGKIMAGVSGAALFTGGLGMGYVALSRASKAVTLSSIAGARAASETAPAFEFAKLYPKSATEGIITFRRPVGEFAGAKFVSRGALEYSTSAKTGKEIITGGKIFYGAEYTDALTGTRMSTMGRVTPTGAVLPTGTPWSITTGKMEGLNAFLGKMGTKPVWETTLNLKTGQGIMKVFPKAKFSREWVGAVSKGQERFVVYSTGKALVKTTPSFMDYQRIIGGRYTQGLTIKTISSEKIITGTSVKSARFIPERYGIMVTGKQPPSSSFMTIFSGGKAQSTSKILPQQLKLETSAAMVPIKPSLTTIQETKSLAGIGQGAYAGKGIYEQTQYSMMRTPTLTIKPILKERPIPIMTFTIQRGIQTSTFGLSSAESLMTTPGFQQPEMIGLKQPQVEFQKQPQKEKLGEIQPTPFMSGFEFGYPQMTTRLFPPFIFPELNMNMWGRPSQVRGRKYRYQPSLAALGLNIKAFKVPSGISTGLVLRPIITKRRRRK